MMKLFKKKSLKIPIILIGIVLIGIILIAPTILSPTPKEFNKTFNNSFVTTDLKTMSRNSTIQINANLAKGYSIKHLNKEQILDGNITIDNKEYNLYGYNLGEATNNVLFGEIREKSTDKLPVYIFYMFDDLSSIYLSSFNNTHYMAAPAKTINDFATLRNKINRKDN
jgi:hypothetical protein